MTCNNCVAKVKSELLKLPGVTATEVQLAAPQATVTMQSHIPTTLLQTAVNKAGKYTIADADTTMHSEAASTTDSGSSYFPIFLIFAYIAGTTLLVQVPLGRFDAMQWMSHFMGGFFLTFSFFKLMNLRGFAEGYQTYDVLAKRLPAYGLVYPFLELGLGVAFLTGFEPILTNAATLVLMSVSIMGVIQSLLKKTQFQCACLGTIIKLPLSKVTLAEDALMITMSAVSLLRLTQ